MLNNLKTVIFDLDGTLLDTAPDLAYALNQLRKNYGKDPIPYSVIRPLASTGSPGLLNLAFGITPQDNNYESLRQEFLNLYDQHITLNTCLFPGMEQVLTSIEKQHFSWAVVTNKNTKLSSKLLDYFQLSHRCACLVGGDLVKKLKPAPDSLLLACKMLEVKPEECIYIGDAERDIAAARAINMPNIAALYGYIDTHEQPENWLADFYINDPLEILNILL